MRTVGVLDPVRVEPATAPAGRMRERSGLLKEAWYAAARSPELTSTRPLGRVILEQPLVLWRSDGRPVAMEDRCAHRNAALSKGAVFDGKLGCPYHGWVYDHEGRCVEVPSSGSDAAPPQCGVRRFPTVERHGLVWVWMGDTTPDARAVPDAVLGHARLGNLLHGHGVSERGDAPRRELHGRAAHDLRARGLVPSTCAQACSRRRSSGRQTACSSPTTCRTTRSGLPAAS